MIKKIDRFQTQQERRVPLMLKNCGRRDRGFQAMSGSRCDHPPKRPKRFPSLFAIIPQAIQEALNLERSPVAVARRPILLS